jgi:hypothetical protein
MEPETSLALEVQGAGAEFIGTLAAVRSAADRARGDGQTPDLEVERRIARVVLLGAETELRRIDASDPSFEERSRPEEER